jgi:hypothetical protein
MDKSIMGGDWALDRVCGVLSLGVSSLLRLGLLLPSIELKEQLGEQVTVLKSVLEFRKWY